MMEKKTIGIIIVVALVIIAAISISASWYHTETTTLTVKEKYIDNNGDESFYMLVTEDGRVFEVDNVHMKGQHAIDRNVWSKLEVNGTYNVKYCGWDSHTWFWDWYEVIYEAEPNPGWFTTKMTFEINSTTGEVTQVE